MSDLQRRNTTIKRWLQKPIDPPPSFIPVYLTDDRFYKNIFIQNFCLHCISRIDKILYSHTFQKKLPDIHTREKAFDFFLKGGNAISILMPQNVKDLYPYSFTGDFDCMAIVNPRINPEAFTMIRETIILSMLNFLMKEIVDPVHWKSILQTYTDFSLIHTNKEHTMNIFNEAITPDDIRLNQHIYENPAYRKWNIPKGCPFQIEIHPNLAYRDMPIGLALLKVKTATMPSLDLLDIAIPSKYYSNITMDWDIHSLTRYDSRILGLSFNMSDFLSIYIDQRVSALLDTRQNKKYKRTLRANRLRNGIRAQIKEGMIDTASVQRKKRLPYTFLDNTVTMADILSNI